jgi:hypothetical protein
VLRQGRAASSQCGVTTVATILNRRNCPVLTWFLSYADFRLLSIACTNWSNACRRTSAAVTSYFLASASNRASCDGVKNDTTLRVVRSGFVIVIAVIMSTAHILARLAASCNNKMLGNPLWMRFSRLAIRGSELRTAIRISSARRLGSVV